MCARGGARAGRGGHGHPHRLKGAGGAPTRGAQRRMRGWDVASPPPPRQFPSPLPPFTSGCGGAGGERGAQVRPGGGGVGDAAHARGGRRPAGLR